MPRVKKEDTKTKEKKTVRKTVKKASTAKKAARAAPQAKSVSKSQEPATPHVSRKGASVKKAALKTPRAKSGKTQPGQAEKKPRRRKPVKAKVASKQPAAPRAAPVPKPGKPAKTVSSQAVAKPVEKKAAKPAPAGPPPAALKPAAPAKPAGAIPPSVPEKTPPALEAEPQVKEIELQLPITVKELSVKLQEKPSSLIKTLMGMRVMCGINQTLEEAVVQQLCEKYSCTVKQAPGVEEVALKQHFSKDAPEELKLRSPIVTLMGHVDHGKTSLLDGIRQSKVVEREHGGITQHIGAYHVQLEHGEITFLDTPGHEAFTAMRARGARITDIVVLVVAADDGVMPQTEEAIDHARAAGVSIIVAINKIDRPSADVDRVKKQLAKLDLSPEDWGGKTITVGVSAKTGEGIDNLLEMIILESQMLELKANPGRIARGVVIEAKMCKGKGPTATLLVQNGTLHLNQNIIVDTYYGKIRAMFNDRGISVTQAGPSGAVEVLGITGVPEAGEQFFCIPEEKQAKELAQMRTDRSRQQQMRKVRHVTLEDLHAQIAEGKRKDLKMIIKADVQGSLEAIKDTLGKLNVPDITLNIIHTGVGAINSSDVILAAASDALILGFHVTCDERARELSEKEGVEVKSYNIIYELANDIKSAVEGMLEPKLKKVFQGKVSVRKVFRLSRSGTVAGCFVTKGKIQRNNAIELERNGQTVFEGKLSSLKRFKDDVREVAEGFECGITLEGFEQLQEGDVIVAYEIEKVARKI